MAEMLRGNLRRGICIVIAVEYGELGASILAICEVRNWFPAN